MFGLHHLFDNGLVGLALSAVLVIFIVTVGVAIYSTLAGKVLASQNFTYVATVISGLVLSVASGVIGAPATIQVSGPPVAHMSSSEHPSEASSQLKAQIASDQVHDFRTLYAWVYVLVGLVCLIVFVVPTAATHDLVKGVGLTMLGFLITIVAGVAPSAQQTTRELIEQKTATSIQLN